MFDFRLFYPQISIEEQARAARRHGGQSRRVYRLSIQPRSPRNGGRR